MLKLLLLSVVVTSDCVAKRILVSTENLADTVEVLLPSLSSECDPADPACSETNDHMSSRIINAAVNGLSFTLLGGDESFASLYVNRTCSDHTARCFEDLSKLICNCDNGTFVFGASSILLGGYANLTAEQILLIEMEDAKVRYLTALAHDLQHNAATEETVNETSL